MKKQPTNSLRDKVTLDALRTFYSKIRPVAIQISFHEWKKKIFNIQIEIGIKWEVVHYVKPRRK